MQENVSNNNHVICNMPQRRIMLILIPQYCKIIINLHIWY